MAISHRLRTDPVASGDDESRVGSILCLRTSQRNHHSPTSTDGGMNVSGDLHVSHGDLTVYVPVKKPRASGLFQNALKLKQHQE